MDEFKVWVVSCIYIGNGVRKVMNLYGIIGLTIIKEVQKGNLWNGGRWLRDFLSRTGGRVGERGMGTKT